MIDVTVSPIIDVIDVQVDTEEKNMSVTVETTSVNIEVDVKPELYAIIDPAIYQRISSLESKVVTFTDQVISEGSPIIKNASGPILQVILIDNDDGRTRYYPEFTTQNNDTTATFYMGWDISDATIKLILE